MSAIHTLRKQLSHMWLVITLLCTALFGTGTLVHAGNEVMVSLSALYDIMPPEASVYKESPEKYFVVNINNPQDHNLDIYLTLKLEKLTGEKFIMEQKVSAKPQSPKFAITLPASTAVTLTSVQLHDHFRHLALGDFNVTGSLLGDVMSSNFGLLPEGDYMATLTAYEYDPNEKVNEKTKPSLSDPKLSTTRFKICYSVKAPELRVPAGVVKEKDPEAEEEPEPTFAGVDYEIPEMNFGNVNTWTWLHLMEVCGNLPNMRYELEFYNMKNGSKGYYTSPENAIVEGNDRVLLYPGMLGPKLHNVQSATFAVPNPESYFQEGEYYAVRVHAIPDDELQFAMGPNKIRGVRMNVTPSITYTPEGNPKLATFRMYENDGYSRPIVVRATSKGENRPEEIEPEEVLEPGEHGKAWKATVTHPKLTFPDNNGNCFGAVYLEANQDYTATWEKPKFVEGDRAFAEKFDYTYNINIYKSKPDAATFEDIITENNKPLYTQEGLEFSEGAELKHTVPWKKLMEDVDSITLGGQYFIEVTANPVPKPGEGQLLFCARGQNCCTYTMFLTEDIVYEDCGALEEYEDKVVVSHGETIEKKQAEMNGFHVVFTSLKATDEAKTTYAGTGYVKWQPLNMSTYIAMSFTGIRMNKKMQVLAGTGTARQMTNADVIPYELIDYAAAKAGNWVKNTEAYQAISNTVSEVGEAIQRGAQWVDSQIGTSVVENKLSEAQQTANAKVQALYDAHVTKWRDPEEVAKACGDYWTKYIQPGRNVGNTLMNWFSGGSYDDVDTDASPTFLPIGLPQSFLPDSLDMDFQVMKFDLSPTRASVGVAAFFYMPDAVRIDKAGEEVKDGTRLSTVLAFVAPRLCVKPTEIWAKEGEFGLLYDFSIKDMSTGYTFTFLAPTDYTKLNDGCAIHWEQVKGETKVNMMVLEAKMTIPGLLNEDRSRMAELRIGARIDDWKDWMAWIQMDAFQVEDLDGYVFNVTGKNGIRLDHSKKKNPDLKDEKGSPLTITEIFKDVRRGDDTGLRGYNWAHPKLGFQGVPDGKDPLNWMGLYVDEISMTFPKGLAISDKEDAEDTSLKLGLRNLLWDNSGVSLTAFVGSKQNPVVKLETGRLGGWALSLDEVAVNVLQGKFSDCHFNGMFEVPLLKGTFDYECKMNYVVDKELAELYKTHNITEEKTDEKKFHLTFTTQQRDEMNLDFWLGSINLDKNGSWFNIDYLDGDTQVEFMASGTVTVGDANEDKTGGKVANIPFDIPGVRFAGLRMANFKYDTKDGGLNDYGEKLAQGVYKDKSSFNKALFQAELNKELTTADFEGGSEKNPFYFNIGRWSLASEEKKMWGFPLRIKNIGVESDTDNKRIGLKFDGELGLMGGGEDTDDDGEDDSWALTAGAGLTIWANYTFNGFDDLGSASIGYDTITVNKLSFDGSFGGGKCTLYGELEWEDNDEKKGFEGGLSLGIQDLFSVVVSGGIWDMKKEGYKNGFFYADIDDVTIPCGPTGVNINRISCGFFWNRALPADAKLDDKEKFRRAMLDGGVPHEGAFGLTFGLGLEFANKTLCSGDFNGFMAYDLKNDALSRLTLLGDMDALKGPDADKGLLQAKVKIDYVDNVAESKAAKAQVDAGVKGAKVVERCQSFTLNATVDFKADTKEAVSQFLGSDISATIGRTLEEAAKKVKESGMAEFGADKADDDNKGDGKTSGKDGAKDNLTASASASFSFEFQLRHYPDKKETKWHVYLGEPTRGKRCEVVFIDFKFDAKLLKVWAKAYANAYICLGNELPEDENGVQGGLPPLPDKLIEILEDDGGKSNGSVETTGVSGNLQTERAKQIQSGPSGGNAGIKGGIQFGAELGAEFGVQIPIGYVNVGALIGFDAILKQYGDCACSDGSKLGGKNGFYALAQIYAALWGSAGVSLDFGFWRGDFPLVDVAFGAVLKGGFPNPTWVYGKMRVKGSVLGGLISFNKAMELRMGKVCVPEVASPLDNIDIFSSYTFGSEDKNAGWGSKGDGNGAELVDPYKMPSFTTNMKMDSQLRLVDENEMNTKAGLDGDARAAQASSTKTFVFHLEPNAILQACANNGSAQGAPKYCDMTPAQNSRTSFTVNTGSFNQYQNYHLHVRGFVKQIIDGREQDPIIRNLETHKDEQKPWGQDLDLYFRTDKWSDDLSQEVMLFMPFDETGVILKDAENPYFCLANDRQDMFNTPDKEWYVTMEVNQGTDSHPKWQFPDIRYDAAGNRINSEQSKWERIGIELTTEYEGKAKFHTVGLITPPGTTATIEKNKQYRFSLYSVDKKQMNEDLNKIKEARKSVVSEGADLIQTLTLLAYGEDGKMTELGQDMMDWYNEQVAAGTKFSNDLDKMDQAITDFEKTKLSDLRYTSLEFQRVFKTGNCNSFAEKLNSTDKIYSSQTLKFLQGTKIRRGGAISARIKAGNDPLSKSTSSNPYYMLNWWMKTACVPMMPAYRLTSRFGDESEYYMKDADLITYHFSPEWHRNSDPPAKRYSNHHAFEMEVSPFYATEWRTQSKLAYAVTGRQLCANMVDSVCRVLYADGQLAAQMPANLRKSWNLFEKEALGKNYAAGVNQIRDKDVDWGWVFGDEWRYRWKEPDAIVDLRDYNRKQFHETSNGYTTAFKNNDTSYDFPQKQMCCILTCDVFDNAKYEPIWDEYYTYITHTGGASRNSAGLMNTNTWPGTTRRGSTDAIYWIAGETAPDGKSYPFSMSDYLATIKKLVFEVRRPTGYDANSGKYALRPSTRFGNTVDVTQSVTLTDNQGSVKVTSNGLPTMKEDNDVHFDDVNFEKYIIAKFDTDGNGKLSKEEALKIKYINYNGRLRGDANANAADIFNLHGIEAMTNLESLTMSRVTLKSAADVNLSANKKLRSIKLQYNWQDRSADKGVSYLPDLSNLSNLDTLYIYNHSYGSSDIYYDQFIGLSGYIDVSKLTHLKYLNLAGNQLSSITGLNNLTQLNYLDLRGNLLAWVDADALTRPSVYVGQQYNYSNHYYKPLQTGSPWIRLYLNVAYTKVSNLISSGAEVGKTSGTSDKTFTNYHVQVVQRGNLKDLLARMPDRKLITHLAHTFKKKSSFRDGYSLDEFAEVYTPKSDYDLAYLYLNYFTLDEDKLVKATSLNINDKGIKSLEGLDKVMPSLQSLQCRRNSLETLDLSGFPKLTNLYCDNNRIVELVGGEELAYIYCSNNALTRLDVSKCKNLVSIDCSKNALNELVLSNCPKLKYLTCSYNQLKSLDASKCTILRELDCSYNSSMTHTGVVSGALWVGLYVPKSIEKLVAKGIYVNDGFTYMALDLPNLTYLDMSDNPKITHYVDTKASTKLEHLDLHNTNIVYVMSDTKNLTYLDISNTQFGKNYFADPFVVDMTKPEWKNIKNIYMSDTRLNRVYVKSGLKKEVPNTLYVGVPNRTTGIKVELQMDENISAKWEHSWKYYARNQYVYGHVGDGKTWDKTNSSNMAMEEQLERDKKMQRNLGEELYKRLKNRYSPNTRWLHASDVASKVTELDCSGMNITDIDSIVLWMPNLEKLDCSRNLIRKANFKNLLKLKSLKMGRNEDLSSLTMPDNKATVTFDIIDVSETKLPKATVESLLGRCKTLNASGVETLNGTIRIESSHALTYLDLQHTNVQQVLLYSSKLETAKLDYCPNLKTVQIAYGTENFLATCGGLNTDVQVKLWYSPILRKWFNNCANNAMNEHTSPLYQIRCKDGGYVWVPVTSADEGINLANFFKSNVNSDQISIDGKEITLQLPQAEVINWYNSGYVESAPNVNIKLVVQWLTTTKYIRVNSALAARNIIGMLSTLTSTSQFTQSISGSIKLTCYNEHQLKTWYSTCDEFFGNRATVRLRLQFKDNKSLPITIESKSEVDKRLLLQQFCRNIYAEQFGYKVLPQTMALFLKPEEQDIWYGKAAVLAVRGKPAQRINYNRNTDVRIYGYAYRTSASLTKGIDASSGTRVLK